MAFFVLEFLVYDKLNCHINRSPARAIAIGASDAGIVIFSDVLSFSKDIHETGVIKNRALGLGSQECPFERTLLVVVVINKILHK